MDRVRVQITSVAIRTAWIEIAKDTRDRIQEGGIELQTLRKFVQNTAAEGECISLSGTLRDVEAQHTIVRIYCDELNGGIRIIKDSSVVSEQT